MATTGLKNLKIYINPTGVGASAVSTGQIASFGTNEGFFLFDEVNQVFYVHGKAYGLTPAQAEAISNATAAISVLNGADSVSGSVAKSIKDALDALMGDTNTGITLGDNVDPTITNFLKNLQDQIDTLNDTTVSGINTEITTIKGAITGVSDRVTALEQATGTQIGGVTAIDGAASHIKVTVSTASGAVSSVVVNESDIANASDLTSLSGVVANIQGSAVTEIVGVTGYTGTSIALDGTKLKVGNGAAEGATETAYYDSTISGAIDSLNTAINALSGGETGTNLTQVLATIEKIKAEIMDTDTEEGILIGSLLDSLSSLQTKTTAFVGINSSGVAPASNEAEALQTSLEHLAALIKNISDDYLTSSSNLTTNMSNAVDGKISGLTGSQWGGLETATATASHVKVTVTTSGGQVSGVTVNESDIASNSDLTSLSGVVANLGSNAKTVALANTGASASTGNYIKVTEANNVYTVEATEALDTKLSQIDNAIDNVVTWTVTLPTE